MIYEQEFKGLIGSDKVITVYGYGDIHFAKNGSIIRHCYFRCEQITENEAFKALKKYEWRIHL